MSTTTTSLPLDPALAPPDGAAPPPPLRDYYCWRRDDVLDQVLPTARRVLSVGCASGITEADLVRRGVEVIGIETNPAAAAVARQRGLHVLEGNAATLQRELSTYRFDHLIYADVLEHIPDAPSLLRHHASLLDPGGRAIITVPNFRNYRVFYELFLRGRFPDADAGIFDRTHVHVTTLRVIRRWLTQAGLRPVASAHHLNRRRDKLLNRCTAGLLRDLLATQILAVGAKD